MSESSLPPKRQKRTYSAQFKAEMVAHCLQGEVSLASLAVEHGMNPNVLHRWVAEHKRYGHHCLSDDRVLTPLASPPPVAASFIPVPFSAPSPAASEEPIRLELKRGNSTVHVAWPVGSAAQCVDLLREWLR